MHVYDDITLIRFRRGLQIMDTRMGFPCPFRNMVIDYMCLIIMTVSWNFEFKRYRIDSEKEE